MKNKKAILLPESLKLFLAVIVIFFLIFLAYQLYGIFIVKTEIEQARETLKQIIGKMENLQDGEQMEYLVTAPKDWYLVSYNKNLLKEKPSGVERSMPKQCQDKDCLCICPDKSVDLEDRFAVDRSRIDVPSRWISYTNENVFLEYFYKEGVEKCQIEGVCINKNIFIKHEHKYTYIYMIGPAPVYWQNKITPVNWISFYKLPQVIILGKKDNFFIKNTYEGE